MFIYFQVLVVIDAKPKALGLPTEAYISVEEVHDVRKFKWTDTVQSAYKKNIDCWEEKFMTIYMKKGKQG